MADSILGRRRAADYRAIPRVVFTDPEVAAVGLTRQQAEAQGLAVEEGTVDLEKLARTAMYGAGYHGEMTVLVDREHGVMVGAWAVAPLASETGCCAGCGRSIFAATTSVSPVSQTIRTRCFDECLSALAMSLSSRPMSSSYPSDVPGDPAAVSQWPRRGTTSGWEKPEHSK